MAIPYPFPKNMKITLACIVGNEEAVIERFIRSFAPAVDSIYLVSATGTSIRDLTTDKAYEVASELGICLLFDHYHNVKPMAHVDSFGKARQMAWDQANDAFSPDYIIWADADDILAEGAAEAIRAAAESASHDVFIMPYHVAGDKQIVMRERMVKASVGSYWQYPIHEQLAFPSDVTYKIIRDVVFLHSPLATKTGGHERNLAILTEATKETSRNFFYLSQEYFRTGQDRKFISHAKAFLAIPGGDDLERYEVLLNLAQTPGQDSRRLAAEAFALMPDRREALALLASYSIVDGDYPKALTLARKMIETEHPKRSYWSQNNEWYGWKGNDLYRQCLRLNGDHSEADTEFYLGINEDRPIQSISHDVEDWESALQYREIFLTTNETPENVDFTFRIRPEDSKSIKMLAGFKYEIIQPELAEVGA